MKVSVRRRRRGFRPARDPKLRERPVGHVSGLVLSVAGGGMLASALVDVLYGGTEGLVLLACGLAIGLPGLGMWAWTRPPKRMPVASIYAAVLTSWVALSVVGTVPYIATGSIPVWHDALFESIAGFTTTGASIIPRIEGLGRGILFWRSLTQWFGGMGVIVLAVAVLPFLGVGGLSLMEAEAPGPTSERLVPRVRETAKRLWLLYVVFTAAVAAAYLLAGMGPYDALGHSFTTVSTGGFSSYDRSLAHFDSAAIEWVAIVAMLVAAGSFALYWKVIRGRPGAFLRSPEARAYLALIIAFAAAASVWNGARSGFTHDIVRGSVFSVVSIVSTTGYATVDFGTWVPPLHLVLLFGMGLGGMTGSTAGGFKVFRLLAILAYARRQVVHQLHPRSVAMVRLGRDVVEEEVVARTVGFFGLFMGAGAVVTLVVAALGSDMVTSISAAAASIGNVGPGLGDVGPTTNFLSIHPSGRMALAALMLVGRLEIFPVLLGLVPLWRIVRRHMPTARLGGRNG